MLGTGLYLALLAGFSTLPPERAEDSLDLTIYQEAGEAILAGNVPYRDFWMTTWIYDYHYGELINLQPPATDLLLIRNLLLVVLWTLMLSLPSGSHKVEPAEQGEPA